MMTLFALVLLALSVWANGALDWWWVVLSVFLALMDLGAGIAKSRAREPYIPWDESDQHVTPLHWMGSALIDLSADIQRVLNELEDETTSGGGT